MYAVIRTGGKQYKVAPEDRIRVERLDGEAGDTVKFTDVLMVGGEGDPMIGAPLVDGATVTAELVEQTRGDKIVVFKKKRRKNYRRTHGHQQHLTVLRITEIAAGGKTAKAEKKAAKADKPAKAKDDAKAEEKAPEAKADAPKISETKTAETKAKAKDDAPAALFTAPEGEADDLKKISGVGPVLEKKLNALGITQYAQIAAFTSEEIERVDDELNFKGRIERDDWIGQAKALADGDS